MKFRWSSSGCESRPIKAEPARISHEVYVIPDAEGFMPPAHWGMGQRRG